VELETWPRRFPVADEDGGLPPNDDEAVGAGREVSLGAGVRAVLIGVLYPAVSPAAGFANVACWMDLSVLASGGVAAAYG